MTRNEREFRLVLINMLHTKVMQNGLSLHRGCIACKTESVVWHIVPGRRLQLRESNCQDMWLLPVIFQRWSGCLSKEKSFFARRLNRWLRVRTDVCNIYAFAPRIFTQGKHLDYAIGAMMLREPCYNLVSKVAICTKWTTLADLLELWYNFTVCWNNWNNLSKKCPHVHFVIYFVASKHFN